MGTEGNGERQCPLGDSCPKKVYGLDHIQKEKETTRSEATDLRSTEYMEQVFTCRIFSNRYIKADTRSRDE